MVDFQQNLKWTMEPTRVDTILVRFGQQICQSAYPVMLHLVRNAKTQNSQTQMVFLVLWEIGTFLLQYLRWFWPHHHRPWPRRNDPVTDSGRSPGGSRKKKPTTTRAISQWGVCQRPAWTQSVKPSLDWTEDFSWHKSNVIWHAHAEMWKWKPGSGLVMGAELCRFWDRKRDGETCKRLALCIQSTRALRIQCFETPFFAPCLIRIRQRFHNREQFDAPDTKEIFNVTIPPTRNDSQVLETCSQRYFSGAQEIISNLHVNNCFQVGWIKIKILFYARK